MTTIELPDLQQGFVDLARRVRRDGRLTRPRGLPTREVLGAMIVFEDTSNMMPVGTGRRISVDLNAAAAAQLVGGVSYKELMLRIAPGFARFDSDGVDRERYGPRVRRQLMGVVRHLTVDPDTREAVAVLQPPRTDQADGGRDFPCTTVFQFFLREGRLEMHTYMRSNDVFSGLSGDAWVFTRLQRTLAWALEAEPGRYVHHVGSLHVYDSDSDRIDQLHSPDRGPLELDGFVPVPGGPSFGYRGPMSRWEAAVHGALGSIGVQPRYAREGDIGWPYAERLRRHWGDPLPQLCWMCMTATEADECHCSAVSW